MHFDGGVDFREAASKTSQPRQARARVLDLQLAPATGVLQEARFSGQFRFEEGATTASSAQARYDVMKGHLALSGGEPGSPPQLSDERMVIRSTAIDVTLSPRQIAAAGDVRSEMRPAAGNQSRGPSLLKSSEAAFVAAEKLTFDEASGRGVYTGQARLFQGDTSINANTIMMDDKKGDLTANGSVRTVLVLESDGETTPQQKPGTTIARGDEFVYEEATRRAIYTKTAQMDGPEGNMRGDRIQLSLGEKENVLKQIDAEGAVKVIVDDRQASGVKLTYDPAKAQYVMVGIPVTMLENCRETKGKILTFFKASDRILIDGNEQQRTESKGGGKCPEPQFE
jgi:lipopolysaccharide export system protein LptA